MGAFFNIIFSTAKKYPLLFTVMIIAVTGDSVIATLLPLASAKMTGLLYTSSTNEFLGLTMH
jgi:hypothetical protein